MTQMTDLYEIIKRHLELKDNWYNNPYIPKEKVEALIRDLQGLFQKVSSEARAEGQEEMICGISVFINEVLEEKKKEIKLFGLKEQFTTSAIRWQKEKLKDADRREKESSDGSGPKTGG